MTAYYLIPSTVTSYDSSTKLLKFKTYDTEGQLDSYSVKWTESAHISQEYSQLNMSGGEPAPTEKAKLALSEEYCTNVHTGGGVIPFDGRPKVPDNLPMPQDYYRVNVKITSLALKGVAKESLDGDEGELSLTDVTMVKPGQTFTVDEWGNISLLVTQQGLDALVVTGAMEPARGNELNGNGTGGIPVSPSVIHELARFARSALDASPRTDEIQQATAVLGAIAAVTA